MCVRNFTASNQRPYNCSLGEDLVAQNVGKEARNKKAGESEK
jgi:hypothetical protein